MEFVGFKSHHYAWHCLCCICTSRATYAQRECWYVVISLLNATFQPIRHSARWLSVSHVLCISKKRIFIEMMNDRHISRQRVTRRRRDRALNSTGAFCDNVFHIDEKAFPNATEKEGRHPCTQTQKTSQNQPIASAWSRYQHSCRL